MRLAVLQNMDCASARQRRGNTGRWSHLSYDYAEKCFKRFEGIAKLPEHELQYVEKGCTPYTRPPYSFVSDGFIALGDAACLTNPWSGEGTRAAWVQAEIAADEAGSALKNEGIALKENLWKINKRYNAGQGAEFARNLALLPAVVGCTPEENDYEFEKSIIFKSDDDKEGNVMLDILKGVIKGRIKVLTFINILSAAVTGQKIYKHYQNYPESSMGYKKWVKRADRLWNRTKNMAELAEKDPLAQ